MREWKSRSAKLKPTYSHTDIIGALFLAGQLFAQNPNLVKKTLVVYSDMRQSSEELNLEKKALRYWLTTTSKRSLEMPDLVGVRVEIDGADGAGKSISYWVALRQFWIDYLAASKANFSGFSALRLGGVSEK